MNDPSRLPLDPKARDYDALREAMLALAKVKLPAWTDHSPGDLGVVLVELFAAMGDALHYYQDRLAAESYLETAVERRSVINLLRLIGYELRPPRPAFADLTLLFDAFAAGPVTVPTDARFRTAGASGPPIDFWYTGPPRVIERSTLPTLRHTDGKQYRAYAGLPVAQIDRKIEREIVGSSDGSPGQRYRLASKPLALDEALVLEVDAGAGPKPWTLAPSLFDAEARERAAGAVFTLRRAEDDAAWVEFGDGLEFGAVPARGRDNIRATYYVGGGRKGNVPAGAIAQKVTPLDSLAALTNPLPASGGAEAEPTADAVRRGPLQFRSTGRAVTAADVESHARTRGVAKVRARAGGFGRVSLFVAPEGGGDPSDALREDVRRHLEAKRVVGVIIDVRPPRYVPIDVAATLYVDPRYGAEEVAQRAARAARALFAFEAADFGQTLYVSKIYEAIEALDGVAGLTVRRFRRATIDPTAPEIESSGVLSLAADEIPVLGQLALDAQADLPPGGQRA